MTRNELFERLKQHIEKFPNDDYSIEVKVFDKDRNSHLGDEFVEMGTGNAVHEYFYIHFKVCDHHCIYCYKAAPNPITCDKCGTGDGRDSFNSNRPFCSEICHRNFAFRHFRLVHKVQEEN